MANDYQAPAAQVLSQMGIENVNRISGSFGVSRAESIVTGGRGGCLWRVCSTGCLFWPGCEWQFSACYRIESGR